MRFNRKQDKERKKKLLKEREKGRIIRKRFCRFCVEGLKQDLDYKETARLEKFLTERGKIIPRRISGNCARHQRKIQAAIKRARHIGMLPFVVK